MDQRQVLRPDGPVHLFEQQSLFSVQLAPFGAQTPPCTVSENGLSCVSAPLVPRTWKLKVPAA